MLRVSVSDTGQGISAEDKEKLFKAFTKLQQKDEGVNQEGVGMGLSICKNIVEKSDGFIEVFSEGEGKGSTFIFGVRMSEPANTDERTKLLQEGVFSQDPYIGHSVDEGQFTLDQSLARNAGD